MYNIWDVVFYYENDTVAPKEVAVEKIYYDHANNASSYSVRVLAWQDGGGQMSTVYPEKLRPMPLIEHEETTAPVHETEVHIEHPSEWKKQIIPILVIISVIALAMYAMTFKPAPPEPIPQKVLDTMEINELNLLNVKSLMIEEKERGERETRQKRINDLIKSTGLWK